MSRELKFLLLPLLLALFVTCVPMAQASELEEITASVWLRGPSEDLEALCKNADRLCEVKHYAINLHELQSSPEAFFIEEKLESIEQNHVIPIQKNEIKARLLNIIKIAKVKRDPNHVAAFQSFLKRLQNADPDFEYSALEGLSLNPGELSSVYLLVKNARYGFAEVLEVFTSRQVESWPN